MSKISKQLILIFIASTLSAVANADDYMIAASWTHDTAYNAPGDDPFYRLEWRITAGGVPGGVTVIDADITNHSWVVTANPGDLIDVRIQARNRNGDLEGPWTAWYSATTTHGPTQPGPVTGVIINVTRQ